MEVYKTDFTAIKKKDGSPLTKADMDSSEIITQYLQPTNIPIVGEESEIAPFKERKSWNENWSIDPLDGTRMFLKKNGEFSVNIAHIQKGKSVFGIIASPTHQRILFGGSKFGVYKCAFDTIDDISTWEKQKPRKKSNKPLRYNKESLYNPTFIAKTKAIIKV